MLLAYYAVRSDDHEQVQELHAAVGSSAPFWKLIGADCSAFSADGTLLRNQVAELTVLHQTPLTAAAVWWSERATEGKRRTDARRRAARRARTDRGWPTSWWERQILLWELLGVSV